MDIFISTFTDLYLKHELIRTNNNESFNERNNIGIDSIFIILIRQKKLVKINSLREFSHCRPVCEPTQNNKITYDYLNKVYYTLSKQNFDISHINFHSYFGQLACNYVAYVIMPVDFLRYIIF